MRVYVVDVRLSRRAHHHVPKLKGHVDHPLSKVKVFIHLVEAVSHIDFVIFIEFGLDIGVRHLSVDYVAEGYCAVAASAADCSSVV